MGRASVLRIAAAAAALILLLAGCASAYTVTYSVVTSSTAGTAFVSDGPCPEGSYNMMPRMASFQESASSALSGSGALMAPIGAMARQAACHDAHCEWQFNRGVWVGRELTFFYGVYFNGVDKRLLPPNHFHNWRTSYPKNWDGDFYGNRQVVMQSDGTWTNELLNTRYSTWICETPKYDRDDSEFFPTFLNGDPIVRENDATPLTHCGHVLATNELEQFVDVQCNKGLVWWGGLIIAVIALIVVVVVVIVAAYCWCYVSDSVETQKRERVLSTARDNLANIPDQSKANASSADLQEDSELL